MATGYNYKKNSTTTEDISTKIPTFPEGTDAVLDGFTGSNDNTGIAYTAWQSGDSWLKSKPLSTYISDFFNSSIDPVTIDPATHPTFDNQLYAAAGQWCWDGGTGARTWVYVYKTATQLVFSRSDYVNGAWTTTDQRAYQASDFPNGVLPDYLFFVMCGAGGQGGYGLPTGYGGGGGGGATFSAIVKLEIGSSSGPFLYFNIAGGHGYNQNNNAKGGQASYFQRHTSHTVHSTEVIVGGGGGAGNAIVSSQTSGYGGLGGTVSYKSTEGREISWWPLIAESGADGGNGCTGATQGLGSGGSKSRTLFTTRLQKAIERARSHYEKAVSGTGGTGYPTWGAGGGASCLGPGGHGSNNRDEYPWDPSAPVQGRTQGKHPSYGYGGGGGGAYHFNWGGGSAPGYLEIYF